MTHVSRTDAKALAVAYSAYQTACDKEDFLGVVVWGNSLIHKQDVTGIIIADPGNVARLVADAKLQLAKATGKGVTHSYVSNRACKQCQCAACRRCECRHQSKELTSA